jgi:hypothetical protein
MAGRNPLHFFIFAITRQNSEATKAILQMERCLRGFFYWIMSIQGNIEMTEGRYLNRRGEIFFEEIQVLIFTKGGKISF